MDENKQPITIEHTDNRKGYLALPFDEDQFEDFLIGLLGRPQTITKGIQGAFEIHLPDIRTFYYLIQQRISQQNAGRLLQFQAILFFDDESTVELNSFAEFETYNEVRPIITVGLQLFWDYLIVFQDKKIPEKQSIFISIFVGQVFNASTSLFDGDVLDEEGSIRIEIEHTARTWAADMEAMLVNHINSLLKKPDKLKRFIKKQENTIALLTGVLFILLAVIGSFWATNNFINNQLSTVGNVILNQTDINTKINMLAVHVINSDISRHYFKVFLFLVISFFVSIIFAAWVRINIVLPNHSFLIFTKKSLDNRNETLSRDERKWRIFISSFIISIVTGLISNYIFIWLVN